MNVTTEWAGDTCSLFLEGDLTFKDHSWFRETTHPVLEIPELHRLVLDLSALGYLDSSALGMFLLLRDKAAAKNIRITLKNPSALVMNILTTVQFFHLFDIVP